MLGILLAVDDGLLQVVPGMDAERAVDGPRMTSVDYRDGLAIAAAPGEGVWVHDDGDWEQRWTGDPSSARVGPDGALWIGTYGAQLHVSRDRGVSWEEMEGLRNVIKHRPISIPAGHDAPYIASVAFPKEGELIGIAGGGGWLTRDGGRNWLQHSDGLDPMIHQLQEHPTQPDRLFATADSGVYRSDDGGFSWVQSLGGLDRFWGGSIAVLPGTPDVLLLTVARRAPGVEGAVFRSPNGGITWTRIMLGEEDEWERIPVVTRLWDSEDTAFASVGDKVWATHDMGKTWIPLATDLPPANAIVAAL